MDVSMDPMENSITDDNSDEQQSQSEGAESSVRPSLSQVKKSWGFRRTTIARREFLDEVGDLAHSPPLVRRGRGRRTNQTPQTTPETCATQRATQASRSVIDDLEWSAPSSPVSEESKPASEASAGGSLDPNLWQDFGSAFHTAFSLLGGNEGLSMEMSHALAVPDILEATGPIKTPPPQATDEPEEPDKMESSDDMDILPPVLPPPSVAGGETDDVVLISSQEEDSDEMTLIQIKEQLASKSRQGDTRARGGKGGRGKARGRGRGRGKGRGKGRGRGRGRGRAVELQSSIADDEDNDDEVVLVNPSEKVNDPQHSPAEIEISSAHSDVSLSPPQRSNSDCIIIDSDLDQITDVAPGQYDDAPEEEEKKDDMNVEEYSGISDSKGYDSNALYCICRQKHSKRFMICCDSCQEWFHGSCVGISETQGRKMEKRGQEYICPPCTTKKQSQLQPEPQSQPEPELSFPECLTLSSSGGEGEGHEEQQTLKETVVVVEEEEGEKAPAVRPKPEPEAEMETDSSLPLCIGPGCSKQALPDSVYCGTDCILQHAAVTMKTLSGPKVPKSRGPRAQRKAATARPAAKGQRSGRMSKRLAEKAEAEGEEEEMEEDDGGQKEAASPLACDPSLTEVQAASLPSSKFYTASKTDSKQVEAVREDVTPSKHSPEDTCTDAAPSSQPEPAPPQSHSQEKPKEPSSMSKQQSAESDPCIPPNPAKSNLSPASQSPSTAAPRLHETGALMVTKTTYVIPKKQSGPQPPSSHVSASASCQKPSSAPALLNETRNLPVPPAPSAPSSRPSQPNNQVRQSIQRSLTSILSKRLCDCEDLEMSESEVAKLVASIEMEMFDIFRNTDSKYMNKYRTIMFNLKDPRNKGLLYGVVRGEISTFRLVRMSQKDMQAIKASEPSAKETTEVKDTAAKATSLLQKPEAVKVDLPSLTPARPNRSTEQKKSLPAPASKTRSSQSSQSSAVPDILACMLKDTTSEHKTHIFDLKCKICTGQMVAGDEEESAKKKPRISESRDQYEPSWRKSAGDDSPLRAPPDSPDMDSPTSPLMDPSSCLTTDSPVLTIVESPASPTMDSPASPTLESPASPVMESPASPTPDTPTATTTKRAYTPVVIPAVSTVTITRRDPRTAAGRFSASSGGTSGPSNMTHNQSVHYAPLKETRSAPPSAPASSLPPTKTLPKSILMKPSSSADPRLYGSCSRTVISESPTDGETAQFLAKQDIVWKGFLNMLTVAKFVTKGYLVSGSAENLKANLPDTIQIGGRIMPQTVWDYVDKLKTSVTKELCVIRFHPATEEEEVAYVSLFSYFSSRGRFGVVANGSRAIKDIYLVPLSAKESIPSMLQPLEGPGLEKKRPNLLLGLAILQKTKRPGNLPQEIEEKRPKVHMSKDPMWIPKPPVLYGSDKLDIFQPYNPETPANTTPPGSPLCPGSPSESSSSGSVTIPSLLTSISANPPISTSATVAATQSSSNNISDNNPTAASSDDTPLQTILKSLFGSKQTDSTVSSDGSCTTTTVSVKKLPAFQVSGSMVDPIVQQYGQKSKVKQIEEEENDFDRPYDPEEEYDPAMGYGMVAPQSIEKSKAGGPAVSGFVDDDVAYDPEDETIFADIQSNSVAKPPGPTQMSDPPSCPTPTSTQAGTPTSNCTPAQTSSPAGVTQNLPTGTVVVSAATLTEQQRMLEELNKQIEEQKRQLKEQEEALRQQREAVGMFMAHFSVSDSLMSPPSKSLPLSQLSTLQSGIMQTESKSSESTDKTSNLIETVDSSNVDSQTDQLEDTTDIPNLRNDADTAIEQDETQENVKENDKYSSAGEIEDSDVAYDPEDESLFNEIQEDVFQGSSMKTQDSSLSRTGHSACRKGTSLNSYHSRKRRLSPKRRSHRERDRHRSPSRKSQRHSPSHSQRRRDRDRHRRSERDRSRHRARDHSERQGRHHKEHTARRHSHGHRRSPSSPRKKDSMSISPKQQREPSPQLPEASSMSVTIKNDPDGHQIQCNVVENQDKDFSPSSHELLDNVKLEISEPPTSYELPKHSVSDHDNTARGSSPQVDKTSQQETLLLNNKFETTVPLREIDPPIRDSPQSPDPEPQFVKPSSIENIDYVKLEKIRDPDTYTNVSMPLGKAENNSLPIGGQATVSNILWPTVGGPPSNVRNLDFIALEQSPVVRDQGMIEADKEIERESPGLNHPETLGQWGGRSNPTTSSDMQGSEPETDPMTKHSGPGMSGPGIRNPGPDMKELGHRAPQIYPRETGIRFPGPDMRGPGMQAGIQHHNIDRIGSGPGMRCSPSDVPEMKGQMLVPPKEYRSQPENPNGRTAIMEMGRNQSFGGPQIEGRATGIAGRGSGRVQRQSRHDGSPALEERGSLKRGFQPHGRDADRLSPAMTDERWGPGRGRDVPVTGTGPNISYESGGANLPREHFKEPRPDIRAERSVCGPEKRETETMHEFKRPDLTERRHMGPGQDMGSMGGSDTRSDRSESHGRSSGRDIAEKGPNRRDADMQGRHIQGPWLERRNEQMGQEVGGPIPNITNPDWRGPEPGLVGPDMSGQRSLNKSLGPHMRDPDWSGPGSDMRDDWRGPDRRGSGPVRGGPFIQDEWRVHQPDRRRPNMEGMRHDRGGPGGPDFIAPGPLKRGPDMEVPLHDRRRQGGPDFMGPEPERRGSDMEVPMHDRTGPGGPDFSRPEPERRGPSNDNLGPGMRGPVVLDFVGSGLERRGLPLEGPGSNRRGPAGPDFGGPWSERRGPDMAGPGLHRRGPGDQDVWGLGPERRGPGMEGSGIDRQGLGDFIEPVPERGGLSTEGPGPARRGPGGLDFRRPGPDRRGPTMEGPGTDSRGPEGPDFRGPGPESRGLLLEGPGPDRRGPGGPDFRGSGPERRSSSMERPRPDSRGPGCPDFRGPGPERRSSSMERLRPDSRGPGCPDFRGPGPERRDPYMEAAGPDRRGPGGPDFSRLGPDRRGPAMGGLGPDKTGQGGPDLRGPGCERRGHSIQDQEPDRRGPGDQNSGDLGPDRRRPYVRSPGPDFIGLGPEQTGPGPHTSGQGAPHFRGSRPESGHPNMEGPGPDRRGPDIRGPRLERPDSSMEGPGPHRRGPGGPNMRRPGLQHSDPNTEGPVPDRRGPEGPYFRGPGPERRPPDMEGIGNNSVFPGGPQFRGPEPERRPPHMDGPDFDNRGPHLRGVRPERTVMEGPGPNRKGPRGPDFRGPGCESRGPDFEGPRPDRQEPGGSGFREPGPERRGPDMDGPGTDWRRSGGPDIGGPGIRQKVPNAEGLRHRRDDWGGADFESEPIHESTSTEGSGPDRIGRNLRGPGPMRRNVRGPGPDISGLNRGERWKGPDFTSDRRGTDTGEQWSNGRGPNMEAVGLGRECSGDDWKRHAIRGPGPIQEGPDEHVQEHSRQDPHMVWRGPGSRGPKPIHERPNMPFPRPLRDPGDDWSGPVQDDPDMIFPGPGRGGPGNEWREPDRRDAEPNRVGPGPFFRGDRDPDYRGQGPERRGPGMKRPRPDMRGGPDMENDWRQPHFGGNVREPNKEGPGLMNSYPNRRGLEMESLDRRGPRGQELRRPGPENRDSHIEGPGPDGRFSDCRGLGSERRGIDMESPGTDRKGFDDFRRERRGPDMRRPRPDMHTAPESSELRHGSGGWDTITEGPGLDSRGSEPTPPHFNHPHQVARFQGPHDPHSAPNSAGNPFPSFDNLPNQQPVKPQRHRAALLPTPTEGLIRFPNRMINNPDVFSLKRKQIGHPMDREWSRGRPVRQDQEKGPAGKICTPGDAGTDGGVEKKEGNETNK